MESSRLKAETEGFIIVAQEQSLPSSEYQVNFYF